MKEMPNGMWKVTTLTQVVLQASLHNNGKTIDPLPIAKEI